MRFKWIGLWVGALGSAGMMQGAQFTLSPDICQNASCSSTGSSYTGGATSNTTVFGNSNPGDQTGTALGNFNDPFDLFGWIANANGLTINRQVETLTGNTYRWLDTFTNNTVAPIALTLQWVGEFGADGDTTLEGSGSQYLIVSDGLSNDPVIAFIFGNNAWAGANISSSFGQGVGGQDRVALDINLSVGVGESTTLMFYTFLALDESDRGGDIALATSVAQSLIASPNYSGLNQNQIASIQNFGASVPEPSSMLLLGVGLIGLGLARRRRSS